MTDSLEGAPTVTVVIATLDRRAWLAEAVESIRRQREVLWELIVVNSTQDDTVRWLAGLNDPRLSVVQLPQPSERGVACAAGLDRARAPLIMFLDDDDLLEPDALAILSAALDAAPHAVAAVGARQDWYVAANRRRRDAHPRVPRTRQAFEDLLFGWSAVSGQNLYRTAMIRSVGGYDQTLTIVDDRDLWLRVAPLGPIVLRPNIVMTYRIHPAQRRPPDLRQLRDLVAHRAIRRLPRADRRRGLLIRKSAALIQDAEDAMRAGRPFRAIGLTAQAAGLPPRPFLSPLLGPWIMQRLAYAAWAHVRPKFRSSVPKPNICPPGS
jgi:glycosyltransferase involved in cell wall biosynthesis